jgi:hypothetical protein
LAVIARRVAAVFSLTERGASVLWLLLAVLYLVILLTLGLTTWRKCHMVLFWIGIIFPILWLIGAVISPSPRAAAAR